MRVAIVTAGSRGDVEPYAALGAGLRAAGHDVRVVTFAHFEPFVRARGLDFRPLANVFEPLAPTSAWRRWQTSGDRPLRFWRGFRHLTRREGRRFLDLFDGVWRGCQGADAIVYPTAGLGGPDVAAKLGVPGHWAHLYAAAPTGAFPCFLAPSRWPAGPAACRATYRAAALGYRLTLGPLLDAFRARTLGLPPRSRTGDLNPFEACGRASLFGFSPALVPRPDDWGPDRHLTGYWFTDGAAGWEPPAALARFLAAGEPPVYVSASSLEDHPDVVRTLAREGPSLTGCRLVLQAGSVALGGAHADVHVAGETSYAWLFPRLRGVVHHAGPGTVAVTIAAGVPSVPVPSFFDQPFWARRLAALGVAPRVLPRRRLTLRRLVEAVRRLDADESLHTAARALASRVAADSGVRAAVRVLEGSWSAGR